MLTTMVNDLIGNELAAVEALFEEELRSDLPCVNALVRHVSRFRGKMLRPTLVLLSGRAAGRLTEAHVVLATVVEMVHMATLVHDDVLDEAEVRRSAATLNHLRGNEAAVMLGDFLISNAFHLCSTLGDPAINLALGAVTNTVCTGELVQLHNRNNFDLDEATYFDIIRRKTASLIGACCELGATLSGAPAQTAAVLGRFGEALGIAFQIQDDLLDLTGEEATVGKSLGKDLDKGKLTLPIIRHLAAASPANRELALEAIVERNVQALRMHMRESGAVESTRATADALVANAKNELATLSLAPAGALLEALADAVVDRTS